MVVVVADGALVACSGTIAAQPWTNVFGLKFGGAELLDQTIIDDVGDAFNAFYDSLKALLSFAWDFQTCTFADLRTATSPSWDAAVAGVTGTNADAMLPSNVAMCVSHKTGFRGKSYSGRTYLGGFTDTSLDGDGTIAAARKTSVLNAFTALDTALAAVGTNGFEHAVVSRKLLEANAITSRSVDDAFDHQDRRKVS